MDTSGVRREYLQMDGPGATLIEWMLELGGNRRWNEGGSICAVWEEGEGSTHRCHSCAAFDL